MNQFLHVMKWQSDDVYGVLVSGLPIYGILIYAPN